ncbi:MAG: sodium:proton antiporter [Proteobacteria bacterium]|nr:sodium:proton antiporter [Pseudomonadota bacterium]
MQPSTGAVSSGQVSVVHVPAAAGVLAAGPAPGLVWALPFLGLLLSFALLPMLLPRWWHRRQTWVTLGWSLALLLPQAAIAGPAATAAAAWQDILGSYLPFVTLLLALYAAGGGVLVRGGFRGTPGGNTALMAVGTVAAGIMGTIGAAMVLIHPLLRANAHRQRKLHLVLVFIVLVANAGGALSPLGPPLYLGFLRGVPFFWPLLRLGPAVALMSGLVLGGFWLLDRRLARAEPLPAPPRERFRLRGAGNLVLILLVAVTVFAEGMFDAGTLRLAGATIPLARFAAIGVCIAVTALSAATTPGAVHEGNDFSWAPMAEVAWFFLALFLTMAPVLRMLAAGPAGPFAPVLALATDPAGQPRPAVLFWLTGALSAVLDNAPSYLMAWGLGGVRPAALAGGSGRALAAISGGATLFGGLTYLGNAPNLMVRAIAAHRGVRMPGFLTYAACASAVVLPLLLLLTAVWV